MHMLLSVPQPHQDAPPSSNLRLQLQPTSPQSWGLQGFAAWSFGGCGLVGKGENPRGTYVEVKMQEVGQHSGGHVREGGQECLEVDLQILLPLFHQAPGVFPNYLFGRKQTFIDLPLCDEL